MSTKIKLVLVGPRAGQTIALNGLNFINGVANVMPTGDPAPFFNYWASYYNAHPFGSDAYDEAVAQWKAFQESIQKEGENESDVSEEMDDSDDNTLRTKLVPQREADEDDADGDGEDDDEADSEEGSDDDDEGNGQRDEILAAFTLLDKDNDDHWTEEGLPLVDVIAELTGIKNIKRADIEAAQPGFRRWHEDDDDQE